VVLSQKKRFFNIVFSNPPTQAQALQNKVNELIAALKH
jgi:hypothetical protein